MNGAFLWLYFDLNFTLAIRYDKEFACQMHETQVQSLGGEDPLEKEMATHSSILAWQATVHRTAKSWIQLCVHAKIKISRAMNKRTKGK